MGSLFSKTARTATNTTRKFPSRAPSMPHPKTSPSTQRRVQPSTPPQPSSSNNTMPPQYPSFEELKDPALSARLFQLGPVSPTAPPSFSNISAFSARTQNQNPNDNQFIPSVSSPSQSIYPSPASNPAVTLLEARSRLAAEAEEELATVGRIGQKRGVLDVLTIRQVLMLRDQEGLGSEEVERKLGLKRGLVAKLGRRGVVSGAGLGSRMYEGY